MHFFENGKVRKHGLPEKTPQVNVEQLATCRRKDGSLNIRLNVEISIPKEFFQDKTPKKRRVAAQQQPKMVKLTIEDMMNHARMRKQVSKKTR